MKLHSIMSAIIFFITSQTILSQVSQEWVRTYNGAGNNNDESVAIVYDGLGNIVVTGRIISTGNNNDICTIKYNTSGVQQWAAIYDGGHGTEVAAGLAADNSGNIYVTGQSRNSALNYDIVLIKYNSSGSQQWVQTWDGSLNLNDIPTAITTDPSGNVYITGYTEITNTNTNYITLKYNSSGALIWAKEYNNPINSYDYAYYIKADADGNVYVTGTSTAQTTGSDFLTIKYNSNGDSSWVARYSGTTAINEIPQGFAVDQNGNVYVTGFSQGTGGSTDYATVKYNSNGVQQWAVFYDSTGQQDIPEDLEVDDLGNVYVTGRSRISTGYNDIATIKYNTSGIRQWISVYNNASFNRDDIGNDLVLDNQGNVYVTGYTNVIAGEDAVTIKYNNSGVEQWVAIYDASNDDEGNAIAIDGESNVYITGFQDISNADFLTIKYSQTVGIHQTSSEIPDRFELKQNYPNPFNPKTVINYELRVTSQVSIKVYNSLGEEAGVLVNEKQNPGSYSVDFDGSGLTSGVYFYRLDAGNFTDVKKMMLIK